MGLATKAVLGFIGGALALFSSSAWTAPQRGGSQIQSEGRLLPGLNYLSPWQFAVGFDYINPDSKAQVTDPTLRGVNGTAGYEMNMNGLFSTTFKPGFSFVQGEEQGVEADVFLLKYGQSLNYNISYQGTLFQPFAEVALGYGWWEAEAPLLDYSGSNPALEFALGLNIQSANGLMPFGRLAFRSFDIDEVAMKGGTAIITRELTESQAYDLGGTNIVIGLGYVF